MNKAIFLDRDGVINEVKSKRVHFVNKPEQFYFIDGVAEAIKSLNDAGYDVFVVTNQGGVGLGYMTEEMLESIHDKMVRDLEEHGAIIKDVRACIHKPHDNCPCRKPKPGMLHDLIETYDIDIEKSYMIGDREPDIEAGVAAGVKSLMVVDEHPKAYKCFKDLKEAAEWILEYEERNE
ncbi:D-glycero-alpha-D-manno-heptose-1,7-bisphosphate 7-phosphatase [Bacillaceae bacterium W0354]